MAEDEGPEGWNVPQRPAMIAAVAIPASLLVLLLAAGWGYSHSLRPKHVTPMTTFPAPGIETFLHNGGGDPPRPVARVKPDPAIAAAKRAQLDAGWRP